MKIRNDKNCSSFENEMWQYIFGESSEAVENGWEGHLQSCKSCQKKVKEISDTLTVYANIPLDDLDDFQFEKYFQNALKIKAKKYKQRIAKFAIVAACLVTIFFMIVVPKNSTNSFTWSFDEFDGSLMEIRRSIDDSRDYTDYQVNSFDEFDWQVENLKSEIDYFERIKVGM